MFGSGPDQRKVALDAKFSMSIEKADIDSEAEIDGEAPETSQQGHPIRDNLYHKMHTYRDALVGTKAAVILYPGTEWRFMSTQGDLKSKNFVCLMFLTGKRQKNMKKMSLL